MSAFLPKAGFHWIDCVRCSKWARPAASLGRLRVRQSQYSRQIKELEDFFQARLVERHGKGVRLTTNGKALARISRFFMLGLSNFQHGCLAEEQVFQIGASATFIRSFLLPILADPQGARRSTRYGVETLVNDDIERRLHDLTLDFGIVTVSTLSRPLQLAELRTAHLELWVPRALYKSPNHALLALKEKRLRLIVPAREVESAALPLPRGLRPSLICDSFIDAKTALEKQALATFLPDFLAPKNGQNAFLRVPISGRPMDASSVLRYHLAWNPRLLRLNPHAARARDFLIKALTRK